MAAEIDSPESAPEDASKASLSRPARKARLAKKTSREATEVSPARPRPAAARSRRRPFQTIFTITAVTGLVAVFAIPAYAAFNPETEKLTVQQLAENGAQTMIVASDVQAGELARESYAATTPEEIAEAKAAEAAAARAKAAKEAAARARAGGGGGGSYNVDLSSIPVGSGKLSWPLTAMTGMSDMFGARGGTHTGVDMLAPAMTPIYASADGVVSQSVEGSGGFGVYVKIEHVIDGVRVSTIYAHMSYGTRLVSPGQTVVRGQQIGSVGSTGYSYANHVHYVTEVNGVRVDPMPWLGAYGS